MAGKTKRVEGSRPTGLAGEEEAPVEPIKIPIMSRRGVRRGKVWKVDEEETVEGNPTLRNVNFAKTGN